MDGEHTKDDGKVGRMLMYGLGGVVVLGGLGFLAYWAYGSSSSSSSAVSETHVIGLQDDYAVGVVLSGEIGSDRAKITLKPFTYTQKAASPTPCNWGIFGATLPEKWTAAGNGPLRFDIPGAAMKGDSLKVGRTSVFNLIPQGGDGLSYIKFDARLDEDLAGDSSVVWGFCSEGSVTLGTVGLQTEVSFDYKLANPLR